MRAFHKGKSGVGPTDILESVLKTAQDEAQFHGPRKEDEQIFERHFYKAYVESDVVNEILQDNDKNAKKLHELVLGVKNLKMMDSMQNCNIYVGDKYMHEAVFQIGRKGQVPQSITHVLCLAERCSTRSELMHILTDEDINNDDIFSKSKVSGEVVYYLCFFHLIHGLISRYVAMNALSMTPLMERTSGLIISVLS